MTNLRRMLAVAALLLSIGLALFLAGYVRLPAAFTILAVFALLWSIEILRFGATPPPPGPEKRP